MKPTLRDAFGASLAMFGCVSWTVTAQAEVKGAKTSKNNAVSATGNGAGAPSAAKQQCLTLDALTGSRITQRKCRTAAEWKALGYDVKEQR